MRGLPATLPRGTARQEDSIIERLFRKVSDSAAIQLVKDQRPRRVKEYLSLKRDSAPLARKRGLFLFLALLIGLAIGGGFWFRKQLLKEQLPASPGKRGLPLFLALLIGSGVGAVGVGLWFRKRLRADPVSPARKIDVSIFVGFSGPSIIPQFEPAVESFAAISSPRPSVVPQDEPTMQHAVATSLPDRLPVEPPPVSRGVRTPISLATKRGGILFLVCLLVLVIAAGLWFGFLSHPAGHTVAQLPPVVASTPTSTRISITPTVPVTPPPQVQTYNGRLYNLAGNVNTGIAFTKFQQNQGIISGYLTSGSKLLGGAFRGTIDAKNHFHFTVVDTAGNATLFFNGAVQSATTLSGDYYSCRAAQGSQCIRTSAEYGIWSVVLAS